MARLSRQRRHEELRELLRQFPLYTDEELAQKLGVSLSTLRLDRALLHVPEVRERAKAMAKAVTGRLRSLRQGEYTGEIIELEPNKRAMSLLQTTPEMAFRHTKMVWDHHIYAQASSLAIAVVEDDMVVIASARVAFSSPAYVGDRLVARAKVGVQKGNKVIVSVRTTVEDREIFVARYIAARMPRSFEEERL